jgi:hypothetical protein
MAERPNIEQVKQKIKAERESAFAAAQAEADKATAEQHPARRELTKDTLDQISKFNKESEELNREEVLDKIDIGATPEGVEIEEFVDDTDDMFYRGTAVDNPKTRKAIETKCTDMDFADLIITGRVTQVVPIVDEKLLVVFRSLLANENFWIEKNAQKHASTDWAMRSWMGYARLAMSIESLNGTDFSAYSSKSGEIDDQMFVKRFKEVMNMGEKLIELLLINLNWFNDRVENLYKHDFEKLKNG